MVLACTIWISVIAQVSRPPADNSIELVSGWRFQPDLENKGYAEGWHTMACKDDAWPAIQAGDCWEEQGFPEVDGFAWYRIRVDVPQAWEGKRTWLVLGAVNDACVLFCNGKRVNGFGNEREEGVVEGMAARPVIADLSPWLQYGGENLLAVKCSDWGNKGGLWRLPCVLTIDPTELPLRSLIAWSVDIDRQQLHVDFDLAGMGNERSESTLKVKLIAIGAGDKSGEDERPLTAQAIQLGENENRSSVTLNLQHPQAGQRFRIEAAAMDAHDIPLAGVVATAEIEWPTPPAWPGRYKSLKVLNNFVTELINTEIVKDTDQSFPFLNPRNGWIVSIVTGNNAASIVARINDESAALIWRMNPDTGAAEAMRFLPEGDHTIEIEGGHDGELIVRTIPEIAYCYYPAVPHIRPYGTYNWMYVTRYVLPHVNTLVTAGGVSEDEFQQWLAEGRQWIANASLPGLGVPNAPNADEVYGIWSANPGMSAPGFSGMIVDEFLAESGAHYAAWTEAVQKLHAHPTSRDRRFYAWCGDLFRVPAGSEFLKTLQALNHRMVWERYLPEEPTAEAARRQLAQDLRYPFSEWQSIAPDMASRMVMCLGYLCAPPESLNLDPSVDYHVFMDMQFQLLATDPVFWNLYGLMEYSAGYADEESLRWAHKLIRHYCIEGNRTPLTRDPYQLPHLENPDFADGVSSWDVQPAEKNSIQIGRREGFSYLQGRYPKTTKGDRFLHLIRSEQAPNYLRQTIQSLESGRLYSLKAISADIQALDRQQLIALSIQVDGVEMLESYGFQFPYPSCYSHEVGEYTREHPAWFNLHRLVFRAQSPTAELSITDWADGNTPGGPIGQEIALNFIEIEPFIEP